MVQDNLTYNELKTVYINEEGLYKLMFHCKLPVAKKFQKWIFKEVLPNIRKTGRFELRNTIKIKEEELAKAVEKLAIKDKEVEDAEERAKQAEEARIKAERKAIRINNHKGKKVGMDLYSHNKILLSRTYV